MKTGDKVFFNTTRECGRLLSLYEQGAMDQDTLVYEVFCMLNRPVNSHDIGELLRNKLVRSSVVRSINSLTRKGLLEKTNHKKIGKYGRPVYLWEVKQPKGSGQLSISV